MEPISTAIAAFGAVQQAVSLIKKAASTVDDVKSLGPLLGRYFEAKHQATKAVKEAKKQGGSNLGRAIEIELAIKQQDDFEKELNKLFFATNNMDVWNAIKQRAADMDREDMLEARRARDAEVRRKKRNAEIAEWTIGLTILGVCFAIMVWGLVEVIEYCRKVGCRS